MNDRLAGLKLLLKPISAEAYDKLVRNLHVNSGEIPDATIREIAKADTLRLKNSGNNEAVDHIRQLSHRSLHHNTFKMNYVNTQYRVGYKDNSSESIITFAGNSNEKVSFRTDTAKKKGVFYR